MSAEKKDRDLGFDIFCGILVFMWVAIVVMRVIYLIWW